jgi:hypothetical protein
MSARIVPSRLRSSPVIDHARRDRSWGWCVIWSLLVNFAGCAAEDGPEIYPVVGRVTLAGAPLTSGTVSFRPTEGGWDQPTGVIDPGGNYTLYTNQRPGAPPGTYRVVVFANEVLAPVAGKAAPGLPKSLIHPRYQNPQLTPLSVTVSAAPAAGAYDLEVTK